MGRGVQEYPPEGGVSSPPHLNNYTAGCAGVRGLVEIPGLSVSVTAPCTRNVMNTPAVRSMYRLMSALDERAQNVLSDAPTL